VIRGGSGRDVIDGGPGNDVLSGGLGNDDIQGGTGTDTLDEDWSAEVDDIVFILSNTRLTVATDASGDGVDALSGLENVRLVGGTGNDLFDVSEWRVGPVRVEGGPGGTDMIRVQLQPSGVPGSPGATATLTNAGIAFTGGTGAFDIVGIEAVTVVGTDWNDVIDASQFSGWASLDGGAGDDVLHAGPGVNWLFGGVGDDRFVFRMDGGALDMDIVSGGGGVDQMDFSAFSVGITLDLSLVGAAQVVAAVRPRRDAAQRTTISDH
jgi:Ca2+-binding RTX toxin-like protein